MTAQHTIGVGVIGCGYWGPKIIRNLTEIAQAHLAAACDLSQDRLDALVERHPGLRTTTDYRELLNDPAIKAVVIATPIRTHFRLAMAALRAGKHVLVEKPLTTGSVEADTLIETAGAANRVLMVGHIFQYNPAVEALRELVRSGELGQIFYIDCARLNLGLYQGDINVIWDLAPHDIAILLHILGASPERVSTHGTAHVVDGVDDVAQLNLRFPFGVQAGVRLSWLDPVKVRRVTVVGSKKMAVFTDTSEEKLRVYDRRVAMRFTGEFERPVFDYHDGAVEMPAVAPTEPLRAQILHFLDCIRTGATPRSDGRVGAEVVRILEAADISRRLDGRWIDVPRAGAASPPLRSTGVITHISEATRARASRR